MIFFKICQIRMQDTIKGLEKTLKGLEMLEKTKWKSVEELNVFLIPS